ncbi:hypothetical protein EYF80_045447 [Liparis tanakae]|uniref:Uncharacterized protein n=1 Tax=Liparis tanakae TaxID=230148 RepID=A0A4Z2FTM2_9TELE|nr:hypothetical protein EYF80_045447 [Liparis tanakae]
MEQSSPLGLQQPPLRPRALSASQRGVLCSSVNALRGGGHTGTGQLWSRRTHGCTEEVINKHVPECRGRDLSTRQQLACSRCSSCSSCSCSIALAWRRPAFCVSVCVWLPPDSEALL